MSIASVTGYAGVAFLGFPLWLFFILFPAIAFVLFLAFGRRLRIRSKSKVLNEAIKSRYDRFQFIDDFEKVISAKRLKHCY